MDDSKGSAGRGKRARGISRRTVLGSAALLAGLARRQALAAKPDSGVVDVAGKDVKAMAKAAIDSLGGIAKFVRPGDYVVLKANAGFANPPAWATTTHPELVAAVAQLCLDAKAKQVLLLENPVGRPDKVLERSGIGAALASMSAVKTKVITSPSDYQKVSVPKGVAIQSVGVAKALRSADVFINLPVAKSHSDTGVSFGLKNLMGLIEDRKVFHTMVEIHQAVADLAGVITPQLTLLDATRVLLTNGPAGPGETLALGRLVAGAQPASVDAYGLTLARFNQKQMTLEDVPCIALAGRAGLGETDVKKLKVKKLTV